MNTTRKNIALYKSTIEDISEEFMVSGKRNLQEKLEGKKVECIEASWNELNPVYNCGEKRTCFYRNECRSDALCRRSSVSQYGNYYRVNGGVWVSSLFTIPEYEWAISDNSEMFLFIYK